jgi:acyl-CoA synthetase (AMP-forming)/AMP-acid ligase II
MLPAKERALTMQRIRQDALALAGGLLKLGLDPNEAIGLPPTPTCARPEISPVVLIQLPNCLAFSPIFLGVCASGLTATLVSPALTSDEISWILQNARPRVIITATACEAAMKQAIAQQKDSAFFRNVPVYTLDAADDIYPLPSPKPAASGDWKELLVPNWSTSYSITPTQAVQRTAVILWSSGTSGRSKGVLLSHHALNFSTASLWHDADYYDGKPQRWLGYVPLYHVFGLCNILLLSLCIGSTVYNMPSFHLETVLAAVPKRKITYFHMAPPVAVMLAKAAIVEPYTKKDKNGKTPFSSVAGGVTGGAPLGHEVVVQVYQRLGFRVRLGYGLSEACSTTLQTGLGEEEMAAHAGDSGRPHWGVEVLIAAEDQDPNAKTIKPAAVGQAGEILIRAPCLMTAYLPFGGLEPGATPDMAASLDALTPDGWFRTGDVGNLDKHGHLRITDRLKELIKVRAYQVAPAELEAVLCSSDSVADAGVIGIYDESEATEWPVAYVVPRETGKTIAELEALAQELRVLIEKRTAKYKWLQGGIVFVQQIPKSPSGKILRRILKNGDVTGTHVKLYQRKKRDSKL